MLEYQKENSLMQEHFCIDLYTDFSYGAHLHQDWEFLLVLDGEIELTSHERTEIARAGELALIFSNQAHAYRTRMHSHTLVGTFSGNYVSGFAWKTQGKRGERMVFPCDAELYQYLAARLVPCWKERAIEYPAPNRRMTLANTDFFTSKAVLYSICAEYLRHVELLDLKEKNNMLLDHVLAYVEENYREDITLASAAQTIGYDQSYLSRCFSKTVGMNFRHFVNQYRVNYACGLIRNTSMPMTEIALQAGFQNIRSFNRSFREVTGKTPSEYKG